MKKFLLALFLTFVASATAEATNAEVVSLNVRFDLTICSTGTKDTCGVKLFPEETVSISLDRCDSHGKCLGQWTMDRSAGNQAFRTTIRVEKSASFGTYLLSAEVGPFANDRFLSSSTMRMYLTREKKILNAVYLDSTKVQDSGWELKTVLSIEASDR